MSDGGAMAARCGIALSHQDGLQLRGLLLPDDDDFERIVNDHPWSFTADAGGMVVVSRGEVAGPFDRDPLPDWERMMWRGSSHRIVELGAVAENVLAWWMR
ncbi:hypothetical protein [Mycobacterium haemophilum]|uniref:hypothetical protein n=1 Tax=Mycobacterium haemophilum TaxID=29311 RepID=UPI0012E06E7D|nr:hypothetical protein [Mycobacterium haemophilum]